MKTRILFCCLFFLILVGNAMGQALIADPSGEWYGHITQEPAGLDARYIFQLNFNVEGNQVTGESIIAIENDEKAWGRMAITGEWVDNQLTITELEITSQSLYRFAYWCIKSYVLVPEWIEGHWVLKGAWESGYCADSAGEIYLEKRMS